MRRIALLACLLLSTIVAARADGVLVQALVRHTEWLRKGCDLKVGDTVVPTGLWVPGGTHRFIVVWVADYLPMPDRYNGYKRLDLKVIGRDHNGAARSDLVECWTYVKVD